MGIKRINDTPITVGNISKLLEDYEKKMYTEFQCPQCGRYIRRPVMAKEADIQAIQTYKSIIFDYLRRYPEIQAEMLEDLGNTILDAYNDKKGENGRRE